MRSDPSNEEMEGTLTRGLMAQSHSSWATDETILTLLQLPCNQH